jgi:hypothetical protein
MPEAMNAKSQMLMRTLTAMTASALCSVALCSVALADGGHGHGGGFSSGGGQHSGGSGGARSAGGQYGSSGSRSPSSDRSHGNFSSGRNFRSDSGARPGSMRTAPDSRRGGGFSGGRRDFESRQDGSPRYGSGQYRGQYGGQYGGRSSGQYRSGQYGGVRIPDATRPGVSQGAGSHPRPGFSTTRPDFGTRADFNGRRDFDSRVDSGRRPGFDSQRTRPDYNGRNNFNSRPGHSFNGRRDFDRRPGFNYGYGRYPGYSGRSHWHGGYWNGGYWPRVYYRPGFVSFWPVLPAAYGTYWYGGVSYYYVDDLYYTWSPSRYGYVVTDPPPVVSSATTEVVEDDSADSSDEVGAASVYVYPRNGQSEEQTSNDRYECHQWAVSQTGFDPTTATGDEQSAGSVDEYRRALIACLDARGYSAK